MDLKIAQLFFVEGMTDYKQMIEEAGLEEAGFRTSGNGGGRFAPPL